MKIGNDWLAQAAHLNVRKDDLLCTRCGTIEPVHPGHGTPMPAFVLALAMAAKRHKECSIKDPAWTKDAQKEKTRP